MNKFLLTSLAAAVAPVGLQAASSQPLGSYQRSYLASPVFRGTGFVREQISLSIEGFPEEENHSDDVLSLQVGRPVSELVIIDASVPDKAQFFAQAKPGVDIRLIESEHNGLEQLKRILADYQNLDALHLVSHADDGIIYLGASQVTEALLQEEISTLSAIDLSLKDGADVLLYGCELAKSYKGETLLETIANNANVNVAASDDLTGFGELGGDWELEIATGEILTSPMFDSIAMRDFTHVLAYGGTLSLDSIPTGYANKKSYTVPGTSYVFTVKSGGSGSKDMYNYSAGYVYVGVNSAYSTNTSADVYFGSGETFNLTSLYVYHGYQAPAKTIRITSDKGGQQDSASAIGSQTGTTINFSGDNWTGITKFTIQYSDNTDFHFVKLDDIVVSSVQAGDTSPPSVTGITVKGSPNKNDASMQFTVAFGENANNISSDDFTVTTASGTATGTVSTISASSGSSIDVTVNSITGAGTIRLDLNANTNIIDDSGNGNNTNGYVAAYTSGSTHTVDRQGPTITSVTIPNSPHKVGDTVTATITVSSDTDDYTTGGGGISGTINGYNLGSLTRTSNTTYTAQFTITDGGTDVAAGSDIAVNLTLTDSSGNTSDAFTTAISQVSDVIYANKPTISLAADTNTINEDGGVSTLTASLANSLNNQWPEDITVNLSYSGTATVTSDYTRSSSIVIAAGNSSGTASVTGVADTLYDAASAETVIVDIDSVSVGTENGTQRQTISITDAETAPAVSLSVGSSTVAEARGTASITATLDHATYEDVTVGLSYSGTATSGLDFDTPSNSITIAAGATSGNASTGITAKDDGDEEGSETILIDVSSVAGGGASENGVQQQTITISDDDDTTQPSVTITSGKASLKAGETATLTFTLSEASSDFAESDITVTGGTLDNFAGNGTTYTATFTPDADRTEPATVDIAAETFTDAAGNNNTAATQLNINLDTLLPSVTITSNKASLKAGETATLTFTLSEASSNFAMEDITAVGGTLDNFAGNGTTYTATFTPDADRTEPATVDIAAETFTDAAGNNNTAATQLNINLDTLLPSVTITSNKASLKAGETATLTFTLSEASSDFAMEDVTAVGGTLDNFAGSGTTYSATFTPDADRTEPATVDISAETFTDAAGNNNTAATQLSITLDTALPSVTISSDKASLKAGETATLTFTLNEASSDFAESDITVTGGSLSGFTANSGTSYTATFTPEADRTEPATVDIAANTFTDAVGNNNTAATQLSINLDTALPSVTITSDKASLKAGETATLTFTLSETSNNFAAEDVAVTGGTLDNFAGNGTTYTATFMPDADRTEPATVDIAAETFTDAAGNHNTAATQLNINLDTLLPSVTITSNKASLKAGETATLTFTLSEASSGFAMEDVTAVGGSLDNFAGNGTTYTATFTPDADRTEPATVDIAAETFTDAAGNNNTVATQLSINLDTLLPSVTITSDKANLKAGETATLTFTLSEASSNFVEGDITVVGGSLDNFAGSGTTYSATFTPDADRTEPATLDIAADTFTDAAGNHNTAATQLNINLDTLLPSVTITSNKASLKAGETATVTFTLSEASSDFAESDITVTGGSLSGFTANSGTSYTATFTPEADRTEPATVDIATETFTDAAGNDNTAAMQLSITLDTALPSVAITSDKASLKAGETAALTFTLNEASTDFVESDITVVGGTLTNFAGSGTAYTATFTPETNRSEPATVDIAAETFTDAAGNNNTAATQLSINLDTALPSVTITSDKASLKAGETATVTFTLSESSSDFAESDITVTGGSLSGFTANSGTSYTATFTPEADRSEPATVDIAADTFTDAAGNHNTAATQLNINLDTVLPSVTVTSNKASLKAGETATLTFTLSEASSNFVEGDITVVGGSLSGFTANSGTSYTATFTPSADSETNATLDINAGVFTDAAGNHNTAATQLSINVDTQKPSGHSVAFGDTLYSDAEKSSASFSFSGAEDGATFIYAIDSSNGGGPVIGTGNIESATQQVSGIDLSNLNDGELTLSVVLTDTAGNAASEVTANSALDTTVPSGHSVALNDTSYNGSEAGSVSFTFSGAEIGANYSYVLSSNNGGADVTGSGEISSASQSVNLSDISGLNDGDLTLSVTVTDDAGNAATAVMDTATLDKTQPTVTTFSASDTALNVGETATITIELSEASSNFNDSDITVTGGSLSGFTANSGTSYTATFTPSTDSETDATLDINAGVFTDAAGNGNTAATQLKLMVDTQAPSGHSVAIDQALINRDNETALSFTLSGLEGSGSFTYQISDGSNSVSGSSSVVVDAVSEQVTGIDVSTLAEGTLTLSVVVSDEAGNAAESISATVTKKYNVAPVLSGTPATSVNEDSAYSFTPTLSDSDTGDTHTFSIINKPSWATFDTQTGQLSGTPDDSHVGTTSNIEISVSDGTDSDTLTAFNIEVVNTNDAPTGQDASFTLDEGAILSRDFNNGLLTLANDDDLDSDDSLTIAKVADPQYGTLTLNTDGSFSYVHDGSENLADSFTFQVVDAANATSQVHTVTLTMNAIADAPTAVDDTLTTLEDASESVNVLVNDSDPENNMVASSVTVKTSPTKGHLSISNGVFTFTPIANANGSDSFTYTVKDSTQAESNEATVSITITPVNDLPVAANFTPNIDEDTPTSALTVRASAIDVEDTIPTGGITLESQPSKGQAAIDLNNGTITYTPNANETGSDSFTYSILDSEGGKSNIATISVNIGAVNDRPIAGSDEVTTNEDTATTLAILENDSDIEDQGFDGSDIALEDKGDGAGNYDLATVTVGSDGVLSITPKQDQNGILTFTYTIDDSEGLRSDPATVTVTITAVNDAPVAVNNTAQLLEEGSFEVNVLGNDTDVDLLEGDSLDPASVTVVQAPANGQVQVTSAGAIVYTARENYFGEDSFTYTVKDAAGAVSNEATVTMTVTPVNDAPVAIAQAQMLDEDTSLILTLSGTDIEDDALVYSITESTSNGELEQFSDNSWRYTPNANFNGADSFKFKVNDGELDSEPVEVSLTINPVNDAPSVQSLSVSGEEDTDLTIALVGSDVEDSSLTYQMVTPPENGNVLLSGNKVTYQPDANFFGQDSFTYIANDGELDSTPATVTIDIAGVNDAPTISGTPSTAVDEDTAYQFVPVVSDNDTADTLRFSITNKPSWASFDQATGMLSGTPGNGDVGITNNIVISVSDGTETASLPGFTLTVNNVNDAPVISGTPATTVNEDTAYYYKPQVTDVDSTSLTFSISNKPTWASFDETSGALSGTPDNSHVGTTNGIVISVSDGLASASLPAFNLTVKNVNDAPVGESFSVNLEEDGSATITPTVSDADQDSLTRKVTSEPSHGVLVTTQTGWTYTPTANFNGIDSFQYHVNDGQVSSATYTVTLNVAAVNDAPVAVDDRFALTANGQTTFTLDVLSNDSDVDEDTLQLDWVRPTAGQASIQDGKILLTTEQTGTVTVQYGITDGKGGKATAKALVTLESGKLDAPTITAPADVEVKATALSTKVDLGTAVAFDSIGKPLPVSLADKRTFFRPGVNTVYWQTEDSQGNTAEASQTVIVHPLVSIDKDGETTEGTSHTVKVHLNGPAPSYPVTIPYAVSGTSAGPDKDNADHDLVDGEVVITEGTVGEITFEVNADEVPEGTETLTITLDSDLNLGSKNQYTLSIHEQNVAPKVTVTVKQGDDQRSKVENSEQAVTVTATVTDPNAGDRHTFEWVADDDLLKTAIAGQEQESTLSFSPSELASAIYHLQLTVTDNGQAPLSVKEDVYLEVVAALVELGEGDSDGDLIPDNQEGHSDSDNDGIPDYQDAISECNVIQEAVTDSSSYLVEGEPGVCLRKGVTVAGNETGGTQLLDDEVKTKLGDDEAADNIGGIFDFVASGLPQAGQSYRVVFPQRRPIPADAVYRKYKEGLGWVDFVQDADNTLASTQGEAGYCPPPGDNSWTPGLTEGHWCVQLTIQDGGPNDDDGVANGSVVDPGGVAVKATTNAMPKALGDTVSVSRNGHVMIDVLANDSDADGHPLTVTNATADFGTVAVVDNWLSYTAKDQFYGVATINYSVSDNNGGTDYAEVKVNVVNSQTPVAVDDIVATDDRTPLVIRVLSNDRDPDGDALTVVSAVAQNGTVKINSDQSLSYTPTIGFEGEDTVTYVIRDTNGLEDTGVVTVKTSLTHSVVVENEAGGHTGGLTLALLTLLGLARRAGKRGWLALLALLSFNSQAAWFVETDLGFSNAHKRDAVKVEEVIETEDTDFYWSVGAGYAFNEQWTLTARYVDMGEGSATINAMSATPQAYHQQVAEVTPVLADGVGLDVGYAFWQQEEWRAEVSLGGLYWDVDFESRYQGETIKSDSDGFDLYAGAEIGYALTEQWTLGLNATRYFIEPNDVDTLALKLTYHFGDGDDSE